jgi:hypothetical protein
MKLCRRQLLAKDSVLQKNRRRFLVLCARLCAASIFCQVIENEMLQAQSCKIDEKYGGSCVITNQGLEDNVKWFNNLLLAVNMFLSGVSGAVVCVHMRWCPEYFTACRKSAQSSPSLQLWFACAITTHATC